MSTVIEWKRIEAGEYWSKDDRFHILKTWDRIYNSHWELYDSISKQDYPCNSLKECKRRAELIVEQA